MPRAVRPEEARAVAALAGPQRYEYFVKRVVDAQEIWGIGSASGWVMASDDDGGELFPVWPDAAYAESCCEGEWADAVPRSIALTEWIEKWLPGLAADARRVAVFPVSGGIRGLAVAPDRLLADLKSEADRY